MARTALLTFDGIKGRFGCGVFLAVVSLLMVGCASGSGRGTEPVRVGGAYAGRFLIQSEPFESTLQLRTSGGGRVTGAHAR